MSFDVKAIVALGVHPLVPFLARMQIERERVARWIDALAQHPSDHAEQSGQEHRGGDRQEVVFAVALEMDVAGQTSESPGAVAMASAPTAGSARRSTPATISTRELPTGRKRSSASSDARSRAAIQ